jgi:imidazolonepropionase-like amidohydrolase
MSREFILAGWLMDGRGDPARENILLTIQKGTITHIEKAVPEKFSQQKVSDYSDCTLLPGLIDAHLHLFMSGTEDLNIREKQLTLGYDDVSGGIKERLGELIECGIVACRDAGDRHAFTMKYKRDYLDKSAFPIQLKVAGAAWHQKGRYGKMIGKSSESPGLLDQSIRKNSKHIDHIKIVNSGLNSLLHFGKETAPQFDVLELKKAIDIGKRLGLKTMVHANGKKPVEVAIKSGCHSIEHGFFMGSDNLKRMADKQISWVPTAMTMKAYREAFENRNKNHSTQGHSENSSMSQISKMTQVASQNLEHQLEQIRQAKELGVRIVLGTDAGSIGVYHGRSVKEELRLLMDAGLSVAEAIQSATQNGARLLDLNDQGVIAKGAPATFVAVAGSPQDLPNSLDRIVSLYILGNKYLKKK